MGIMLDAGWANVVFGGKHFQIPISCASVLSIIMETDRHSEAFQISFLQQQTQLPAATVRIACKHLVELGLFEFFQEEQAVQLDLKFIAPPSPPQGTRTSRPWMPTQPPPRHPFTTQYLRLVKYLYDCFKANPCLDEVLFTA